MASAVKTLQLCNRLLFRDPKLYRVATTVQSAVFKRKSSDKPISRFSSPELQEWPADMQERVRPIVEKSGFLPNVFKVLARRPDEFRAFFDYHDALMLREGGLTKAEKEMIVVAVSSLNHCTYCVVAHGALLRIYSKNPLIADQVATNWREADLTEREKAILEFAEQLATPESVEEEDLEELYSHGLDEEDIWDVGAIVALFSLSNRMAFLTRMRPNDEFYILGRMKRDKK